MPLVSFIIPTFNSAATIHTAIESILGQTNKDYEICIVDGNSSDNTLALLQGYPQIKYISEPDKGIYDAMNKGIDMAKGEWLFFLGSDDKLSDEAVLAQVFEKPLPPTCNVVYGNVRIKGTTTWAKDGEVYDGAFTLEKLLTKNICHQCIFYKTSFIKKEIGYYNLAYRLCADWDFNLRCWAKSPFLYTDAIIADFNAGGESTRTNADEPFANDFIKNVVNYFSLSAFDPLLENAGSWHYPKVAALQKKQDFIKYIAKKISRKISRKALS